MENETGNLVVKKLETFMPIDVYEDLTSFAKANAGTAFGKFDYSVAIRILLMKSQYADMIMQLDDRVTALENPDKETLPEGTKEIKTFADLSSNNDKEVAK